MRIPSRRQFLLGAGSVGLTSAALVARFGRVGRHVVPDAPLPPIVLPETLQILTVPEFFALAAATERIFPRDVTPGAIDLGVPVYVDRALALRVPPPWTEGLRAGLARLDADATQRFAKPFCRVRVADQDALLMEWDADVEQEKPDLLRNLVTATLEGALGDPLYGGNPAGRGWTELGFRPDPYSPMEVKG